MTVIAGYDGLSRYKIDFGNITLDGYTLYVPMKSEKDSDILEISIDESMAYSIVGVTPAEA